MALNAGTPGDHNPMRGSLKWQGVVIKPDKPPSNFHGPVSAIESFSYLGQRFNLWQIKALRNALQSKDSVQTQFDNFRTVSIRGFYIIFRQLTQPHFIHYTNFI